MKRRGWLHRSKPMKRSSISRKSPMKRKPRRPRKGDNPQYLADVRLLPCCVPDVLCSTALPHVGRIHAHHAGRHGMGQKAPDDTGIPLCTYHHAALHDLQAPFRLWTRAEVRAWEDARIEETRAHIFGIQEAA